MLANVCDVLLMGMGILTAVRNRESSDLSLTLSLIMTMMLSLLLMIMATTMALISGARSRPHVRPC